MEMKKDNHTRSVDNNKVLEGEAKLVKDGTDSKNRK